MTVQVPYRGLLPAVTEMSGSSAAFRELGAVTGRVLGSALGDFMFFCG